jgi:tRNA 2-thiouridine synthesizing protein A
MINILDARGYNCPIPVLKARKALSSMDDNAVLTVLATDPASAIDIPHFCNTTGNELLESVETDGVYSFTIRKIKQ